MINQKYDKEFWEEWKKIDILEEYKNADGGLKLETIPFVEYLKLVIKGLYLPSWSKEEMRDMLLRKIDLYLEEGKKESLTIHDTQT